MTDESAPKPSVDKSNSQKKRAKKAFINSSVLVHDKTQIETIFDYRLVPKKKSTSSFEKQQTYEVDLFLFVPKQMDVNAANYNTTDFFDDLRPILRFREPKFAFKAFFRTHGKTGVPPFHFLHRIADRLNPDGSFDPRDVAQIIDESRLFACSFSNYFRKKLTKKTSKLRAKVNIKTVTEEAELLLRTAGKLLREWRLFVVRIEGFQGEAFAPLREELRLIDEYCSNRFFVGLSRMIYVVQSIHMASAQEFISFHKMACAFVRYGKWLYKQRGFFWVDGRSKYSQREEFGLRNRMLKRHVSSILFLETIPRKDLAWRKEIGYMLAAGFAGAWAFIANIFILQLFGGNSATMQDIISSSLGMFLLLGAALAYVLKDRIKEIGRLKFSRGLRGTLPDHSEHIWYSYGKKEKVSIGRIQEYAGFVTGDALPDDIKALKAAMFPDRSTAVHEIIHYRKVISLDGKRLGGILRSIHAVKDIIRLNIGRFTEKLDDPVQEYFVIDDQGYAQKLAVPKVYHLNMVVKYSHQTAAAKMEKAAVDVLRLVLNKEGLVRLDRL